MPSKLKFIQSISSGMDQYSKEQLGAKGVRLASAAGVNARAVAEHAIALILAIFRRLPEARDNQHKKMWRGMIGDLAQREDELGGKTLLVVGMGRIGSHLALLAKAFGMKVIGIRRDPSQGENGADSIYGMGDLVKLVPQADIVALTCALTPETTGLMSAAAFAAMKPVVGVRQRGARQGRRRGRPDRHHEEQPHLGRRDRRHRRGAVAGCLAAVDACPTSSSRRTPRARRAPTRTT